MAETKRPCADCDNVELRCPPTLTVVPADDSPRWRQLDALREMGRQFVCHPVSRGISDCEEAGELMTDAASEIERLCRVRNCLAGSARHRVARLHQLERQRDYLMGEMSRIDNDPGNSGHYASEAIAAICAEEGARDFSEESARNLRDIRPAALLALGLLWMTERQSDKVHLAYTTLRDALGGKEALREGIQAAMNAGHEADHPHGADWWAGKDRAAALRAENERLRAEIETERIRLAACGVVALSNTPESAARSREMKDEYWSASCADVAAAVDREMALRADAERYRWLTADHPEHETRETVWRIAGKITVRGKGATDAAIDAARETGVRELPPGSKNVAEYLAKVEADPRRAAALQRARERTTPSVLGTGSAAGHTTAEFSSLRNQAHGYGVTAKEGDRG